MGETVSFPALIVEALRLLFKRRTHVFLVMGFGLLAAGSYALTTAFDLALLAPPKDPAEILSWLKAERDPILLLSLFSLALTVGQAIIRGPAIIILENTLLAQTRTGSPTTPLSRPRLIRSAVVAFLITGGYLVLASLIALLVFSPVYLALRSNPSPLPIIFELSALLFTALLILFYFIKEFALYYALLGELRIQSAIDLGYALFRKNIFPIFLFGFLLVGFSVLFTFVLDSAIIVSALANIKEPVVTLFLVFILSGLFALYEQLFRLLFFHSLAAPKKKNREPEKVTPVEEVSETVA